MDVSAQWAKHSPAIPPAHPAFQPILRNIAKLAAEESSKRAAAYARAALDLAESQFRRAAEGDDRTLAAWRRDGLNAMDVSGFAGYLADRIRELEIDGGRA